jgi:hypothetical protein
VFHVSPSSLTVANQLDLTRRVRARRPRRLPVGLNPCSTAFSSRFCAIAFFFEVDFAFVPCGVLTR